MCKAGWAGACRQRIPTAATLKPQSHCHAGQPGASQPAPGLSTTEHSMAKIVVEKTHLAAL